MGRKGVGAIYRESAGPHSSFLFGIELRKILEDVWEADILERRTRVTVAECRRSVEPRSIVGPAEAVRYACLCTMGLATGQSLFATSCGPSRTALRYWLACLVHSKSGPLLAQCRKGEAHDSAARQGRDFVASDNGSCFILLVEGEVAGTLTADVRIAPFAVIAGRGGGLRHLIE